jgi:oligoendopeptidase F
MAKSKRRRKPIRIKKANQGKLRKSTGTKKGQKIPAKTLQKLSKSKNPTTRKRAQFALNARKWGKGSKS